MRSQNLPSGSRLTEWVCHRPGHTQIDRNVRVDGRGPIDPGAVMDAGAEAFAVMAALAGRGDRVAMAGAAVAVGDACLRLCASPATSARAADDKTRFLVLMVGWAWPRDAVLDAARRAESAVWGGEIDGLHRLPQARTT